MDHIKIINKGKITADNAEQLNLIGKSKAMARIIELIDKIKDSNLPVVIQGESGTGKDLIAKAIHLKSIRSKGPFVCENCGAIPESLWESALFGHVKGAFTGADQYRPGLFEVSNHGTLFLDEIGELSPSMQTKLLRVVQDGKVKQVGSNIPLEVDVRIIVATNRDLRLLVQDGEFREDLYYRLNVIKFVLPPLRDRKEDIPFFIEHFLKKHGGANIEIAPEVVDIFVNYNWPGNIRELENEIIKFTLMGISEIKVEHIANSSLVKSNEKIIITEDLNIKNQTELLEKKLINKAIQITNGNKSYAAKLLGLSRYGLLKKMKRYNLIKPDKIDLTSKI